MSDSDSGSNDAISVEYGSMRMLDALETLQRSLNLIRAKGMMQGTGAALVSADIKLETVAKGEVDGSVTILVVTIAGAAARTSTQTVTMKLTPNEPIKGLDTTGQVGVIDSLVSLTEEMANTVRTARSSTSSALGLAEGAIAVDLVVSKQGSIEVATPSVWKAILSQIGFDAKASVAGEFVSTSSITLNFGPSEE